MILQQQEWYRHPVDLNFHPLEVVDRGSETQLLVGENGINGLYLPVREVIGATL